MAARRKQNQKGSQKKQNMMAAKRLQNHEGDQKTTKPR